MNKKKGKVQKHITINKVFGDKSPKDLTLADCEKAIIAKPKPKVALPACRITGPYMCWTGM